VHDPGALGRLHISVLVHSMYLRAGFIPALQVLTGFSKGDEGRNAVSFPNNDSRVAKEKVLFRTLSGPLRHSSGEPQ
jgi:hypothetical protein